MPIHDLIRRWRGARLCAFLGLALPVAVLAASTTPSANPASTSSSTDPKAHSTGTHAAAAKRKLATHKTPATTASGSSAKKTSRKGAKRGQSARKRGQQVIDSARTREIQQALIREHYLEGEPSGAWDSATQAAMQRYQGDRGWQSKTIPDSRALIQLGLGPSHDHLLNPDSAMTSTPAEPKADEKQPAASAPQR